MKRKQYRTATCYILVVEKLDGPTMGQRNALRLLQVRRGGSNTLEKLKKLLSSFVKEVCLDKREFVYSTESEIQSVLADR